MIESADDARKRANLAAAALRLVNDVASAPLVAAADRGETSVSLPVEAFEVPAEARFTGRLYDSLLIQALEAAGQHSQARACRIFAALGFALSTTPEVEREEDVDRVSGVLRRIRITQLDLGFAAAQAAGRGAQSQLLQSVALPPAHLWRARAENARLVRQFERRALAAVSEHAERGADSCRLSWRELSDGPVNSEQLNRLAEALRARGFRIETIDSGSTLRLNW